MNDHYEKVFDAITSVEHNKKDKTIIEKMHGDGGQGHEIVLFSTPVRATGEKSFEYVVKTLPSIIVTSTSGGICKFVAMYVDVVSVNLKYDTYETIGQ